MDSIDKFLKQYSYKFGKGYPDMNNEQDILLLESLISKLIKKEFIFEIYNRQNSIKAVNPGGVIVHIGLTQPSGTFDFRKATLQEITFVGTYCYTNRDFEKTLSLLSNNSLGKLEWIEYRELNKGAQAFKEIHDGTCSAPKIILIP